jgi:hypothetical protein
MQLPHARRGRLLGSVFAIAAFAGAAISAGCGGSDAPLLGTSSGSADEGGITASSSSGGASGASGSSSGGSGGTSSGSSGTSSSGSTSSGSSGTSSSGGPDGSASSGGPADAALPDADAGALVDATPPIDAAPPASVCVANDTPEIEPNDLATSATAVPGPERFALCGALGANDVDFFAPVAKISMQVRLVLPNGTSDVTVVITSTAGVVLGTLTAAAPAKVVRGPFLLQVSSPSQTPAAYRVTGQA